MKKNLLLLVLFVFVFSVFATTENIVKIDFAKQINPASLKNKGSLNEAKTELTITGDLKDKYNHWRTFIFKLPYQNFQGKQIVFSGKAKANLSAGTFAIMVREVDAKGKSIYYNRYDINKTQDWQDFTATFIPRANTKTLYLFVLASKMDNNSTGTVKDLEVTLKESDIKAAKETGIQKINFTTMLNPTFLSSKVCKLNKNKNEITIYGDEKSKNNSWRTVVFPIYFQNVKGEKVTFSGEIKTHLTKGVFVVMIREIDDKNRSVLYTRYVVSKSQDWKKFSKTFSVNPKTKTMQLYILADKLSNTSFGSARDLQVSIVK